MKRFLLASNAKLYALMIGISLLWAGFAFGVKFQINTYINYWDTPYPIEFFLFPAVYLILHRIALHLESEREYASGKGYYAMAIFTLGSMTLYWVVLLINRFPDLQHGIENIPFVEIVVFPAMLFVISAIIAVLYFICAAQTRKDLKISD